MRIACHSNFSVMLFFSDLYLWFDIFVAFTYFTQEIEGLVDLCGTFMDTGPIWKIKWNGCNYSRYHLQKPCSTWYFYFQSWKQFLTIMLWIQIQYSVVNTHFGRRRSHIELWMTGVKICGFRDESLQFNFQINFLKSASSQQKPKKINWLISPPKFPRAKEFTKTLLCTMFPSNICKYVKIQVVCCNSF